VQIRIVGYNRTQGVWNLMMIKLCEVDDWGPCFDVLRDLHTEMKRHEFDEKIRRLSAAGYQIAMLYVGGHPVSMRGFHFGESFAWDKYLYIDDMATKAEYRSKGYGGELMVWVKNYVKNMGISQIHLDSRVIRHEAHKFYINQNFIQGGYHFHLHL
jgi:GNAT superfamily N-acetyltransferase